MPDATMSTKGQVVIPAEIRRSLGLGRKVAFRVEERDGSIVLTPIRDLSWRSLRGSLSGDFLTAALEMERRSDRERES